MSALPLNETPPIFRAFVRVAAEPVTFPVRSPENPLAVRILVEELNVKLLPVFGETVPVASVTKSTLQLVSVDSSLTDISLGILVPFCPFCPTPISPF